MRRTGERASDHPGSTVSGRCPRKRSRIWSREWRTHSGGAICKVPGIDAATFQKFAGEAKVQCPLSKALASVEITLAAKLVQALLAPAARAGVVF